jgi:hypothetical protein
MRKDSRISRSPVSISCISFDFCLTSLISWLEYIVSYHLSRLKILLNGITGASASRFITQATHLDSIVKANVIVDLYIDIRSRNFFAFFSFNGHAKAPSVAVHLLFFDGFRWEEGIESDGRSFSNSATAWRHPSMGPSGPSNAATIGETPLSHCFKNLRFLNMVLSAEASKRIARRSDGASFTFSM